jgi:hypothetical protein
LHLSSLALSIKCFVSLEPLKIFPLASMTARHFGRIRRGCGVTADQLVNRPS